jgi:branched-chain amino acid transport system permease protein
MQREWIGQAIPDNPLAQSWSLWLQAQQIALPGAWVMILLVISIICIRNLKSSTTGRAMLAIREDWLAGETVGIPTTRYKVAAFVLGGALAGLAGGLYAHHQYLTPDSFRFMFSVELVTMVILGGQGSITGTVLAAAGLTLLPQILRTSSTLQHLAGTLVMETSAWNTFIDKWRIIINAIIIIIIVLMIFRPQGLFGHYELDVLWAKWRRKSIRNNVQTDATPSQPAMPAMIPNPQPVLTVKGLVMEFGGLRAVDDFNLVLEPISLVGIIGPNGAGKTTVFNAIPGLYPVTAGTITLAGHALTGLQPHHISALGLARTFQNIRLFKNLSVLDQFQIAQHVHHQQGLPAALMRHPAFYREADQVRAVALDLLAFFNLEAYADQLAGQLCYGDQRRLEIARALATRPKILLLDEPVAGLNPAETRDLMHLIERIQREFSVAILLIEHDMKLVMGICQHLVVLDYGRTIAAGPPASIRQDDKVIAAYLGAVGSSG